MSSHSRSVHLLAGKAAENVVHSLHEALYRVVTSGTALDTGPGEHVNFLLRCQEFEDLAERRQSLLKVVRHEQEEVTLLLLLVRRCCI